MLNSAVLFLHSSGLSDNHSIHQKYNTYIVRQSEIFHKSCSWSVCSDCLPCKSTFLLAYKNCFPEKTLPSPLHVHIFFLLTGSQNFSICFINIGNRYQKNCRRECPVCFQSRLKLLLLVLSAGKNLSFNGNKKFSGIIYARTKIESKLMGF